jgi:hypothetical protein
MKAAENAVLEAQAMDHVYGVEKGAAFIAAWPTSPCAILFLDFDGVMNSHQSSRDANNRYAFAKSSVEALNTILQNSCALIVITSTWRELWSLAEVAQFLERDGVLRGRVVGKTPKLGLERGSEIDAWLKSAPFPVRSYAILDDRDDMMTHRSRLVQVDPRFGLTTAHAQQALKFLAIPTKIS